jgi:hypothetical protein
MANYKLRDLKNAETTTPPIGPLTGGRLAKRDRVLSVLTQQDRLVGNGRRVVCRVGLHGASGFQVLSSNPTTASQIYPTLTASRTAARAKWTLTPGHFPVFSALVVPSGMTQKLLASWVPDTAYGRIDVRCEFAGAATETVVFSRTLPVSQETWAAEKTAAGASWAGLTRVEIPLIYPANVVGTIADLQTFSDYVLCDAQVQFVGGVRCVDAVVQEAPYRYARDLDADADFMMPLATDGSGQSVKNFPVEYPIEQRSATDPSYGSLLASDVAHRQQTALGPILAHWTAWDEGTQSVASLDTGSISTSSTTFVNLLDSGLTAWSSARQGWSLSSGGQAQQFRSSNGLRELRDADAVVPVRIWVW